AGDHGRQLVEVVAPALPGHRLVLDGDVRMELRELGDERVPHHLVHADRVVHVGEGDRLGRGGLGPRADGSAEGARPRRERETVEDLGTRGMSVHGTPLRALVGGRSPREPSGPMYSMRGRIEQGGSMTRQDPLRNLRFRVEIDNLQVAGFSEVIIGATTTTVIEYR